MGLSEENRRITGNSNSGNSSQPTAEAALAAAAEKHNM